MQLILVTEIWGRTAHVEAMAAALRDVAERVVVVDPYDGADPGFSSEDAAYARYVAACGHAAYADRVGRAAAGAEEPVLLVGFSAGAGAVWSVVTGERPGMVRGAVCFYGSSIRTMLDRTPAVPTDLIFPDHEPHFDVDAIIGRLRGTDGVRCRKVPQGHGFMNPLSQHYAPTACARWLAWLRDRAVALRAGTDGAAP